MPKKFEQKKMAIINFTSDFPNKYSIAQLARWSGLYHGTVKKLCDLLCLEVNHGVNNRSKWVMKCNRSYFKKQYLPE